MYNLRGNFINGRSKCERQVLTKLAWSAIAVFSLGLSGNCAAAQDRLVEGFPDLPRDARSVAERSTACQHWSGEITGDNLHRDRQVVQAMKKLRCQSVERDMVQMRRKYRDDPKVLNILQEAVLE